MFYEYAIDPAVFTTFERVRYFVEATAPGEGRFISEYPRKWKALVFGQLSSVAGRSRKQAEILLENATLIRRRAAPFDGEKDWTANVVAEDARLKFRAVVTESGTDAESHICVNDVSIAHPRWAKFSGFVPRTRRDMLQAIGLLIRHAEHVVIIDRFFGSAGSGREAVFGAFAEISDQRAHFEVFCEPLETRDPRLQLQKNIQSLASRLRGGQKLTVHVLLARTSNVRFHNRYLLTNVGGVSFGDSIQFGAGVDLLTPLTKAQIGDLRRDYCAATTAFTIADTFTVSASR